MLAIRYFFFFQYVFTLTEGMFLRFCYRFRKTQYAKHVPIVFKGFLLRILFCSRFLYFLNPNSNDKTINLNVSYALFFCILNCLFTDLFIWFLCYNLMYTYIKIKRTTGSHALKQHNRLSYGYFHACDLVRLQEI